MRGVRGNEREVWETGGECEGKEEKDMANEMGRGNETVEKEVKNGREEEQEVKTWEREEEEGRRNEVWR